MKKKYLLRNQKGFTLIEIIAVLVILGILAALAIPKYMSLQDDAKLKAIQGAIAAGGSNAYMLYSKTILGGTTPTMASLAGTLNSSADPLYTRVGDFSVSYLGTDGGAGAKTITVTITGGPAKVLNAAPEAAYYANINTSSVSPKTFVVE